MKKVGILTTFRQPNWGSVLQAYALEKVIEDLGFSVELIDYRYPNDFHWKRGKTWGKPNKITFKYFIQKSKHFILVRLGMRSKLLMELLNEFIKHEITVSEPIASYEELHKKPPIYDIYISGSDQIWNPNTMLGDMSYLFDFVSKDSKKIAYASSFSCLRIPQKYEREYKHYLSLFYSLSVRENNGKKILKQLLGIDVNVVLDPTLLLPKAHWEKFIKKAHKLKLPKQYILCYMLSYTFEVEEPMGLLLTKIQKKYNMPVLAIKGFPNSFQGDKIFIPKSYGIGIEEFLFLISQSSIVVSSSFHGTAFALNFGKPLVAMGAKNDDDRVQSLLSNLGLYRQFVYSDSISELNVNPYYDLDVEQNKLEDLRKKSMKYLFDSLK